MGRSRTMVLGVIAAVVAFVAGTAVGGALGLVAQGEGGSSPSRPPATVASLPPRAPVVPDTLLAWTPGQLPEGLNDEVAALDGVAHVVSVVSGTAWLSRSYATDGTLVDRPPRGMAIPLEVAGASLADYEPFLSPVDRSYLPELARGQGVLGATSATLRRLGAGATLRFGARRVRIAGVVPDTSIGAHEVFVSRETAARLGVVRPRYLLVDPKPEASADRIAERIRAMLPAGVPLRVRGPNETTYMRQGDAVLAPVILKELFGEFAARPAAGGNLDVDPSWESAYIVTTQVPILGTVRCNRAIIPQLRGALAELQRRGLSQLIDTSQYGGCYAARFLLHDRHRGISHHSWGIAVDINVGQNPFGHTPHQDLRLWNTFERWGFIWGGRFLVPDGMHFEFVRFASGG